MSYKFVKGGEMRQTTNWRRYASNVVRKRDDSMKGKWSAKCIVAERLSYNESCRDI